MPTWVKVLLGVLLAGILSLVVIGVVVVKFFNQQVELTERAGAEGRGYGFGLSIERCAEEGARRSSVCEGITCAVHLHAFMWGCLENASYDSDYCALVAPVQNDVATANWTAATCSEYGHPDNETCRMVLAVVPSFCSYADES